MARLGRATSLMANGATHHSRNPLSRKRRSAGLPTAAGIACWLSGVTTASAATYTFYTNGPADQNQWLNASHWTGATTVYAGTTRNPYSTAGSAPDITGTDIAQINAFGFTSAKGLAINFAPSTLVGLTDSTGANGVLGLGQISYASTATAASDLTIGNSSGTAGILRLNGAITNGVTTVLSVKGNANLLLANTVPGGTSTMRVMLGTTAGTVQVADGRSLTIASDLIERFDNSNLTLAGNHTGRLLLGGVNTYTGLTRISGGTLAVLAGGSLAGNVTIDAASGTTLPTLAGNGVINGTVTVNGAITAGSGRGDLSNRDTVGTLTTTTQTWAGGGSYVWKINSAASSAMTGGGVAWDKLVMSSLNLSAPGGTGGVFTIRLMNNSTGPLSFTKGQQFQIAHLNGAFTAPTDLASRLVLDTSGLNMANAAFGYSFVNDGQGGTNLMLTYTAAPEPFTTLLVSVGASTVLASRRGRMRRAGAADSM